MNARKLLALCSLVAVVVSAAPPAARGTPVVQQITVEVPMEATSPAFGGAVPVPTQSPYEPPPPADLNRSAEESQAAHPTWPPYPTAVPYATPCPEPPRDDYAVNPFMDTREDHLSTFAMDVDTASYTKMRDYINSGQLPPAELVRVEEFVNYFSMEYPDPTSGAFSINLEGGPSPFGGESTWLLRVGIQGRHIAGWERKDALLTYVIDVSGSMQEENRIDMVKAGLSRLVDRLGPNDRVALVAFSATGRGVLAA